MSQNIIILIGPPGGGKGSISKLCTENFGWYQLSTGNLCRDHIARQTEIGKKIDFILKSGKLISDNLISEMVENWLENNLSNNSSVIFDGYPRTVVQVKTLHELLNRKFKSSKLNLIRLIVDDKILIRRLASRIVCINNECQAVYSNILGSSLIPKRIGICDKCDNKLVQRDDDNKEAVKERLDFYQKNEKELLNACKQLGFDIFEINAAEPIDKVFTEFRKINKV